jgi:uncharacterized protein
MNLEQIEKLNELKEKGMITEEEYQQAKARILNGGSGTTSAQPLTSVSNYDYCMFLHLSQFCSWLFPLVGIVVPFILWQSKKDDPYVDQQGRVAMNWALSSLIYAIVSVVLCLLVIGFFMLTVLAICSVIFIIMGALDANKGIVKSYPLSIQFFSVTETPR